MIYIALANVAAILFADVYLLKGQLNLVHLSEGVLNSILGGVFFVLLLPLFEKLFDFTTDLTLLELGNLNLPLFKEIALEAPGTYHHSIVVGNLAEVGARVIGADPILARVGSYYHDIGKLKKPQYFIENQIGIRNPHDDLKPQMSALVIISHVKDGVEMAKKMKLPNKLINKGIKLCRKHKAVIFGSKISDTVKGAKNNMVLRTISRNNLYLIQTPQFFDINLLKDAYKSVNLSVEYTDDAAILESLKIPVYLYQGDRFNIKITRKSDLKILNKIL